MKLLSTTLVFLVLFFSLPSKADMLNISEPLVFPEVETPLENHGAHLYHLFDLQGLFIGTSARNSGTQSIPNLAAGDGFCSIGLLYQDESVEIFKRDGEYYYRYSSAELAEKSNVPFSVTYSAGGTNNSAGTSYAVVEVGLNSECSGNICSFHGLPAKVATNQGEVKVTSIFCAFAVSQDSDAPKPLFKDLVEASLGKYLTVLP